MHPQLKLTNWVAPGTLLSPLYVGFSGKVEPTSAAAAITIVPAIAHRVMLYSRGYDNVVLIAPDSEWNPVTRYTVTIAPGIRSSSGDRLPDPVVMAFTTDPFRVSSYRRDDGSGLRGPVWVLFNSRCDTAAARQAFHISPEIPGAFEHFLDENQYLSFRPTGRFSPHTTYTVTIDTTLRSMRGYRLSPPYEYTFTTGGE